MGTTTQKLEYLGTTKSQLKDQINYGLPTEKQITSSTTFRNYVSSIFEAFLESLRNPDTLFTNLPKTSGSGSNITLNNTANAPMRITLNPTAISQDGTPTPDNPQDIHTISGNNSIKVEGKNLFDSSTAVQSPYGYHNNYGTLTHIDNDTIKIVKSSTSYDQRMSVANNVSLTSGTTITISWEYGSDNNNVIGQIQALDTNNNVINITSLNNNGITSPQQTTLTSNITYLWLATSWNKNGDLVVKNIQLEKGNTKTSYIPYQEPQTAPINLGEYEIGTIGNYSNEFVRTSGKNLFDKDNITTGYYISSDGSLVAQASSWYSDYILVKPSTTYTIQVPSTTIRVAEYNNSKTFIQRLLDTTNLTYTFTTNSNTNYLRLSGENTQLILEQLELGNQATDYEPYGTNEWYIKKNIGKVVLDGSESGWNYPNGDAVFYTYSANFTNGNYLVQNGISNYYVNVVDNRITNNYYAGQYLQNNQFTFRYGTNDRIYVKDTRYTTASDFKTWLSSNNLIVYYVMETPTYTKITGELAQELEQVYKGMLSYDGTTNISQINNDLPFGLVGSAIQKL